MNRKKRNKHDTIYTTYNVDKKVCIDKIISTTYFAALKLQKDQKLLQIGRLPLTNITEVSKLRMIADCVL